MNIQRIEYLLDFSLNIRQLFICDKLNDAFNVILNAFAMGIFLNHVIRECLHLVLWMVEFRYIEDLIKVKIPILNRLLYTRFERIKRNFLFVMFIDLINDEDNWNSSFVELFHKLKVQSGLNVVIIDRVEDDVTCIHELFCTRLVSSDIGVYPRCILEREPFIEFR